MAAAASRQNGAGRRLGDGARRGAGPFPGTRGGDWRRRTRRAGRLLFLYAASAFLALPGYRPLCPGPSLTLGPPAPPRLTAAPPQFAIVCDGRPARFTVEAACGAVAAPRRWQHAAGRELALPRGAAPALGAGQPPRHRPGGHLQLRLDPVPEPAAGAQRRGAARAGGAAGAPHPPPHPRQPPVLHGRPPPLGFSEAAAHLEPAQDAVDPRSRRHLLHPGAALAVLQPGPLRPCLPGGRRVPAGDGFHPGEAQPGGLGARLPRGQSQHGAGVRTLQVGHERRPAQRPPVRAPCGAADHGGCGATVQCPSPPGASPGRGHIDGGDAEGADGFRAEGV
ncbi:tafazzin isoform X3 [Chroicocephalus ridibundus]|uniref:tafazzin isoform X3 n=1 Tax=Chroicocephalus ridibundus TaxID=1192867 RepID=UPI002FDD6E7B